MKSFKERLLSVRSDVFEEFALELFQYQALNNSIFSKYIEKTGVNPKDVDRLNRIPFLPVSFFKQHRVTTGEWKESLIFESSGTTGQNSSYHYIRDEIHYRRVSSRIFNHFFGDPQDYVILGLLPSYLERNNSSLIYMVNHLMQLTRSADSGFYLYEYEKLINKIEMLKRKNERKILIWGVTYALLDLAEKYPVNLEDSIVIETGGMKGRRRELVREEVHSSLKTSLKLRAVHSEYGMTELMSQAYAHQDGRFRSPGWMRIFIREINDPFNLDNSLSQGGINIIDLANIDSCAFIATDDLGKINADGTFEILGRLDNSDARGCNLLLN